MLKKKREARNRKAAGSDAAVGAGRDLQGKISHALDIPRSAMPGDAHLEISSNREVLVDGCQGVLEYNENVVKLTTGKMAVKFTGRGLYIKVLTHDSAVVEGFIQGIEFLT